MLKNVWYSIPSVTLHFFRKIFDKSLEHLKIGNQSVTLKKSFLVMPLNGKSDRRKNTCKVEIKE